MARFHVNTETGNTGICKAESGSCPFGGESGDENHYSDPVEAIQAAEKLMKEKHSTVDTLQKKKAPSKVRKISGKITINESDFVNYHESKRFAEKAWPNLRNELLEKNQEKVMDSFIQTGVITPEDADAILANRKRDLLKLESENSLSEYYDVTYDGESKYAEAAGVYEYLEETRKNMRQGRKSIPSTLVSGKNFNPSNQSVLNPESRKDSVKAMNEFNALNSKIKNLDQKIKNSAREAKNNTDLKLQRHYEALSDATKAELKAAKGKISLVGKEIIFLYLNKPRNFGIFGEDYIKVSKAAKIDYGNSVDYKVSEVRDVK